MIVDESVVEENVVEELNEEVPEQGTETDGLEAGEQGEPEQVEEYEPNFKFNAALEEHEFEDWAKELVKSKDVEENIRKLYAKGFGIESVTQKRDEYKNQYDQLKEGLNQLSGFVKEGDISSFLDATGITKETIFDWVQKEIQYQELPPEQRARVDMQRQMEQQHQYLQQQNDLMQQQMQQQASANKANELNMALSDPKVSNIAKSFDARQGRQGAFREEVVKRGQYHFAVSNQVVSAQQAIDEVLQLVGTQLGGQQSQPVVQQPKPVIPNIQAGSGSPVKKQVSSIADIRARREQLLTGQ